MQSRIIGTAALCVAVVALAGCTTEKRSSPTRTATEELLISTAADRAAEQLSLKLPHDKKLFIDASNVEGPDSKYAISSIKREVLRRGGRITSDQKSADIIVEISLGALSIDEHSSIIGIPQFSVPVPASGELTIPEVALFKKEVRQGVAKFSAFGYDAKTGELISSATPDLGTSHKTQWVVALFISWDTSDLTKAQNKTPDDGVLSNTPVPLESKDLPGWF
ncbi:MAG: DUF6655 family protein [Parvibaculaceae bacterium]